MQQSKGRLQTNYNDIILVPTCYQTINSWYGYVEIYAYTTQGRLLQWL